jgi:tetratricopeptide (TPR) repeat protein
LLRQALSQRVTDERSVKARKHFDEGMRQLLAGEWVRAAANLRLATTFAPQNPEYADRLREAEAQAASIQADHHFQRGGVEEKAGRFDFAARCYEQALTLKPEFESMWRAAQMFLKIRNLEKAERYGIKATELSPGNALAHMTAAQVFREAGQFDRALRSLQRVLELDPQNALAKSQLKEVQKLA